MAEEPSEIPPPKDMNLGIALLVLIAAIAIIGFIGYKMYFQEPAPINKEPPPPPATSSTAQPASSPTQPKK